MYQCKLHTDNCPKWPPLDQEFAICSVWHPLASIMGIKSDIELVALLAQELQRMSLTKNHAAWLPIRYPFKKIIVSNNYLWSKGETEYLSISQFPLAVDNQLAHEPPVLCIRFHNCCWSQCSCSRPCSDGMAHSILAALCCKLPNSSITCACWSWRPYQQKPFVSENDFVENYILLHSPFIHGASKVVRSSMWGSQDQHSIGAGLTCQVSNKKFFPSQKSERKRAGFTFM